MSEKSNDQGPRRSASGRQRSRGAGDQPRRYSKAAPSQRTRRADPARLAAFRTVTAVSRDDAYANLVLPEQIRRAKLDKRDAGFATELTYGTLRAAGTYDRIIGRCIDRRIADLDAPVLDALRLGAHQLLAMRTDDHAAVNETVSLVRDQIGAGPGGFANAVLRRISQKSLEGWIVELTADADPTDALAVRYAHPAWVVRALRQSLRLHGRADELEALLEADNAAPEVHLVGLPGLADEAGQAALASAVEAGAAPSRLIDGAAVHHGGDVGRLPGVRDGALRVQDIGSQWIAQALAEPAVQMGERWLDLCAGPGGKAALLAALAAQYEVTLLANEPAPHRAELVAKALASIDEPAWEIRTGDGRTIRETEQTFDRILIDAPCTGLGALRRRPEARWRRQPKDLADLTVLQADLIDAAVEVLEPEGLLAYATCSPHHAETLLQVEDALKRHPQLTLLDAHEPMRGVARPDGRQLLTAGPPLEGTAARTVQLWPHIHGTDAMFFALLQKQPE
ncbi:RsmB/NOP family class I SAM-dependent RNA methyltransferase [Nesterenkonia sp. NBAIMH1]|uniref:RsmB/NOP family class I SAM-dependent RNA methyltransferase n=1 Tax=Nesterenkonia sp. NBAIMH1 TaxID=2600320 RepID=UPI0011B70C47|nr:transcription antitermination factor NusB [Nesterenkonia sp. NBAIMH1]